jgi:spore germination protein GerM
MPPKKITITDNSKPADKLVKSRTKKKVNKSKRYANPFYILIIMVLLTAVALLVNYNFKIATEDQSFVKREPADKRKNKNLNPVLDPILPDKQKNLKTPSNKKDNQESKIIKEKRDTADNVKIVKVYFLKIDEKTERTTLVSASRSIKAPAGIEASINELIKGPSGPEKKKGFLSAVPSGLRLKNARIFGKNVVLDFNGAIEQNAAGTILLSRIDQIVYTATQFSSIDGVVIKINGKAKNAIGSDGLSIGGVLKRRSDIHAGD